MKKTLLIMALAGIFSLSLCSTANAASITVTKPTVQLNTTQEESALSKKMKEIEQAKSDAKAKQEADKKSLQTKKDNIKKDIEKTKTDVKEKQEANEKSLQTTKDNIKKDIEKTKTDVKEKQKAKQKESKAKKEQRKNAIKSFKDSLK